MNTVDRATGGMLALACGDALANGVEFQRRGSYPPIIGMDSSQRYLPVGQWSDDTAMALCLAESLVACDGFDPLDQMRRYTAFWDQGKGWPCDVPLVPGKTTLHALSLFKESSNPFSGPTHPLAAGNGGLMRLLPAVLAAYPDLDRARHWARESTRTTHGAPECVEASELLAVILMALLEGKGREEAIQAGRNIEWRNARIVTLARGEYRHKPEGAIKASGYVVDTLEAALWCFCHYDSLEGAVLAAANLGDDCDTAAAVTGQLAGIAYGRTALPADWLDRLAQRQAIEDLAAHLINLQPSGEA